MRFWFSGPRIMGIRPGISLGREDFRQAQPTQSPRQRMDGGFVYAIRGDHNLIKIGVSQNPNARLASLRTASAFPLELCFVGACQTSGIDIEREAHNLLDQHRTHGEWFDCSPELAGAAIMGAAAKLGQKIASVPPNMVDRVIALSNGATYAAPQKSLGFTILTGILRSIVAVAGFIAIAIGSIIVYLALSTVFATY